MHKLFIVLYPDKDEKNLECLDEGFVYIPKAQVFGENLTLLDVVQSELTGFKGEPLREPGPGDLIVDVDALETVMIEKVGFRVLPNENNFLTVRKDASGGIYMGNVEQTKHLIPEPVEGEKEEIIVELNDKTKRGDELGAILSKLNNLEQDVDKFLNDDNLTDDQKRAFICSTLTELVKIVFVDYED